MNLEEVERCAEEFLIEGEMQLTPEGKHKFSPYHGPTIKAFILKLRETFYGEEV